MQKKPDNSNSTVVERDDERKSRVPVALILAIIFVAVVIAGGMMLWFNIAGARTVAVDFLQRIEPESKVQETYIQNQYALLNQREAKLDDREREVSRREKDQDALQMDLEKREEAFMALQEDPNSPIYQNAIYLGALYSELTPAKAASLLQTVDDLAQIKRILSVMPQDKVTAIMELMPDDFAADLTLSILGEPSY